ncbi:fatty acid desaturase family protein [Marinobacter mobilis]|uniref:fatty acid desaturase family protein n=1 Tax=Marinobacter mobilis TaxID=488533 RepID=UPI0035C71687
MSQDLAVLNKQAIAAAKQYMGHVAWVTVALTLLVVGGFVLNLALFAAGAYAWWVALPILAILTYASYTPLHEAAHGNVHGSRDGLKWLNDLCGYLVAPMIAVPYASHRHEHFTHHRYTNQPDKDPDYVVSGMSRGPVSFILTVVKFLWVQNSFFVKHQWGSASLKDRVIFCAEVLLSLGWRVAFLTLVDQPGAVAVVLVGYLAGALFTAYWFAYRPHVPYQDSARYRNTNSLIMPRWMKPLEWFWLGQNLHSIHHLFPRVPFYRYHALHRDIEPVLRAHGTPIVGIFSRKSV